MNRFEEKADIVNEVATNDVTELLKGHSLPLRNESETRTRKGHDLQEILAGTDSYLQTLSDTDPDWEQSCCIRGGIKQG
jgi:hypothetical protein